MPIITKTFLLNYHSPPFPLFPLIRVFQLLIEPPSRNIGLFYQRIIAFPCWIHNQPVTPHSLLSWLLWSFIRGGFSPSGPQLILVPLAAKSYLSPPALKTLILMAVLLLPSATKRGNRWCWRKPLFWFRASEWISITLIDLISVRQV